MLSAWCLSHCAALRSSDANDALTDRHSAAQARREIAELHADVRKHKQLVDDAMAQVNDSVRKRENHKSDLVRALRCPLRLLAQ